MCRSELSTTPNIPFPDVTTCNDIAMELEPIFSSKRTSDEAFCAVKTELSESETDHEVNSASCALDDLDMTLFVHLRTEEEILSGDALSDITVEDIENNVETDECISEADELNINDLPQELLQKIFTYLRQYDLCHSVSGTCKLWRDLAYDPVHWQMLDFNDRNVAPGTLIPCINRATRLKRLKWHDDLTLDEVISPVVKLIKTVNIVKIKFCKRSITFDETPSIRIKAKC